MQAKDGSVTDGYVSAEEAAALLGVTIETIYVYVTRKKIRSIQMPNSHKRLYWRADVERARLRGGRHQSIAGDLQHESAITLYTHTDLFFRGRGVRELTETASFEDVAAHLWEVEQQDAFTATPPLALSSLPIFDAAFATETQTSKAMALFSVLERADASAYDLSRKGMARTGGNILRWLCALILNLPHPVAAPIHEVFGKTLGLSDDLADLVRRLLILSADHGLTSPTFAVRAVASTGVTPWRSVLAGLVVSTGQHSRQDHFSGLGRIVSEIVLSAQPVGLVRGRLREGQALPGFQPADATHADARVAILSARLQATMASDRDFEKLHVAAQAVGELSGMHPTFGYYSTFAWRKIGLKADAMPFLLGRSAGWVAHAIEQYQAGERERAELAYRGPLPGADGADE